jgi:hypothetical protein
MGQTGSSTVPIVLYYRNYSITITIIISYARRHATIGTSPIEDMRLLPGAARLEQATDPHAAAAAPLVEAQRLLESLIPKIRDIVGPLRKACGIAAQGPGAHLVLAHQLTAHLQVQLGGRKRLGVGSRHVRLQRFPACGLERQVPLGGPALRDLIQDAGMVEQRVVLLQLPILARGLALGVDLWIDLHGFLVDAPMRPAAPADAPAAA